MDLQQVFRRTQLYDMGKETRQLYDMGKETTQLSLSSLSEALLVSRLSYCPWPWAWP